MTEYKYISIVINKFDLPFEIKLATPDEERIDQAVVDETVAKISENLKEYDDIFSLENRSSILSRFQDGEEAVLMNSKVFEEVYEQTITAEQMTQHYFSSYFNGKYDPIGLLNGWMIDRFLIVIF